MFLVIIFLSYLLGCASTIALIVYLYRRYGLDLPGTIAEQEQYQTFQPIPEVSLHFLKLFSIRNILIIGSTIKKFYR